MADDAQLALVLPAVIEGLQSSDDNVKVEHLYQLAQIIDSSYGEEVVSVCRYLRSSRGVEHLVSLIQHSDEWLHQTSLLVIGNLASSTVDSSAEETRKLLKSIGAFEKLLPHLDSTNELTVTYALGAIRNTCADAEYVLMMQQKGVMHRLKELASSGVPQHEEYAVGCLHNITEIVTSEVSRRRALILKRREAVTIIQKDTRRKLARKKVRAMRAYPRLQNAAIIVQKDWRMHRAREIVADLRRKNAQHSIHARKRITARKLQWLLDRYLLPIKVARMTLMAPSLREQAHLEDDNASPVDETSITQPDVTDKLISNADDAAIAARKASEEAARERVGVEDALAIGKAAAESAMIAQTAAEEAMASKSLSMATAATKQARVEKTICELIRQQAVAAVERVERQCEAAAAAAQQAEEYTSCATTKLEEIQAEEGSGAEAVLAATADKEAAERALAVAIQASSNASAELAATQRAASEASLAEEAARASALKAADATAATARSSGAYASQAYDDATLAAAEADMAEAEAAALEALAAAEAAEAEAEEALAAELAASEALETATFATAAEALTPQSRGGKLVATPFETTQDDSQSEEQAAGAPGLATSEEQAEGAPGLAPSDETPLESNVAASAADEARRAVEADEARRAIAAAAVQEAKAAEQRAVEAYATAEAAVEDSRWKELAALAELVAADAILSGIVAAVQVAVAKQAEAQAWLDAAVEDDRPAAEQALLIAKALVVKVSSEQAEAEAAVEVAREVAQQAVEQRAAAEDASQEAAVALGEATALVAKAEAAAQEGAVMGQGAGGEARGGEEGTAAELSFEELDAVVLVQAGMRSKQARCAAMARELEESIIPIQSALRGKLARTAARSPQAASAQLPGVVDAAGTSSAEPQLTAEAEAATPQESEVSKAEASTEQVLVDPHETTEGTQDDRPSEDGPDAAKEQARQTQKLLSAKSVAEKAATLAGKAADTAVAARDAAEKAAARVAKAAETATTDWITTERAAAAAAAAAERAVAENEATKRARTNRARREATAAAERAAAANRLSAKAAKEAALVAGRATTDSAKATSAEAEASAAGRAALEAHAAAQAQFQTASNAAAEATAVVGTMRPDKKWQAVAADAVKAAEKAAHAKGLAEKAALAAAISAEKAAIGKMALLKARSAAGSASKAAAASEVSSSLASAAAQGVAKKMAAEKLDESAETSTQDKTEKRKMVSQPAEKGVSSSSSPAKAGGSSSSPIRPRQPAPSSAPRTPTRLDAQAKDAGKVGSDAGEHESVLQKELREARLRGQLQAAKSEVTTLYDCVERQHDELESLKRELDSLKRNGLQRRTPQTAKRTKIEEEDPWKDQMRTLCLSSSVEIARKHQLELQESLQRRMQSDEAWVARNDREFLLRSFMRAKQAVQEAETVAHARRIAWSEQRRQHVLRGELIDAETRASRARLRQEAEAAERQRLLRKQLLEDRLDRSRTAAMFRSASKPVLPALNCMTAPPTRAVPRVPTEPLPACSFEKSIMPRSQSLVGLKRGSKQARSSASSPLIYSPWPYSTKLAEKEKGKKSRLPPINHPSGVQRSYCERIDTV
ncbi:hypothetical protein AB1Y20_023106 [Prymnesium parvum]|uniref:Protein HGH1 homolog n=1 Tax=Prymnesium parvum TaxID=97485 RepID=A0AB34JFS6_PRYPA